MNKSKEIPTTPFDTSRLINDANIRQQYEEILGEKADEVNTWDEISVLCKMTAEEVIGYTRKEKKGSVKDKEIEMLSIEQKNIRMKMINTTDTEKLRSLRESRKKILKNMKMKLKTVREKEVDDLVNEVEKSKDDARMFRAVKNIKRKNFENPVVHDKDGKNVTEPNQMYSIVNDHFRNQFHKTDVREVERFIGPPRPLNQPITTDEVTKAVTTMSNNKAPGKDNISVELLKYAPTKVDEKIAATLNNMFEKHGNIDTGTGILVPLPKPPPKKRGPVKNLRPVNLLLVIRKILSKIALRRSEADIEQHLSHTQSAYRKGRSTTDIVWAYRWLIAKIQEYDITIYVTGIDMSSAFDTIYRDNLVTIAERILDEDGVRLLRILLSDTTIEVRIKGAETSPFKSNIGVPQGDSYSGPQFTTYFEDSLKEVRNKTGISIEEDLPEEMIYADDYDNLTESKKKKKRFQSKATEILKSRNLNVNEDKTEETTLKRCKHDKQNKNEPWRDVIKLGSKLGDKEDIQRRKQLATGSIKKMEEILKRKKVVNKSKKLKLYNALVKSVLTYNACTWGLTQNDEKDIDSFHRRQLRQVIGVKYPLRMRNQKVYKVTKSRPLSVDITHSRWKMFGHALRLHENTPARKAMKYFFQVPKEGKKFRGRKRATIVTTLNRDIKRTKAKFNKFDIKPLLTEIDLRNTRVKAMNRKHWQKCMKMIVDAAYSSNAYQQ